jgi:hypothetical protein
MMYSEKLVVAVKHNGRVLREQGDTVFLPFGCEYTLYFKNLNSVRALVRVSIDGTDATDGVSLIVQPNESVELERFIEGGNFEKGHRFKFIERTQKIEDGPRGAKAEDGLIRVEFEFERVSVYRPYNDGWLKGGGVLRSAGSRQTFGGIYNSTGDAPQAMYSTNSASASASTGDTLVAQASAQNLSLNDAGITVHGSVSDQKFEQGAWFPTDGVKHVLVMKLLGQLEGQPVREAVTVKTKVECPTCGTKSKPGTKFCPECGTGLSIL